VSDDEAAPEAERGSFGAGLGLGGLSFLVTLAVGLVSSIVIARIYGVRIVGELRKLGITVSATLVRNVLARAGVPPAPERAASSWRSFSPRATDLPRSGQNQG